MTATARSRLERVYLPIGHLDDALRMLGWDEAVMMPDGSSETRAATLAALAGMRHERLVSNELHDALLSAREQAAELDPWQRANVELVHERVLRARALPGDLVAAQQQANSRCQHVWTGARADSNWSAVLPLLETVFDLTRQRAAALAQALGCSPYDALMGAYQRDVDTERVAALFDDLGARLRPRLDTIIAAQRDCRPPRGRFPVATQKALCEQLMRTLGFDFSRGRLDVSHHPFCGGVPDDCRITTRYREDSFLEAIMAVLHETGHGMYQQSLPSAWRRQPVGEAAGMAVHESQSLIVEMIACRSREFFDFAAPLMREALAADASADASDWSADNLHRLATRVARGYIRVDADEVSYPLHVMLRFELERALIDGQLQVRDIPEAWDAAMRSHLGLATGDNHRDGCMQDVHWFAGLVGYFPMYTLGALMAAQLFDAARRAQPDLLAGVGQGDFAPLTDWLRTNIHQRGSSASLDQLVVQASGDALSADAFLAHIDRRYDLT